MRGLRVSVALAWVCAVSLPVGAQSNVRFDLGSDITMPQDEARIPMTLESGDLAIVAVQAEIVFPAVLTYIGADLADAGKMVSAEISAELKAAAGDGASSRTLVVKIDAPDGQVLSSGLLAVARFKVPATGGADHEFTLTRSASAMIRGGKTADLAGTGGTITILEGLAPTACFFFMH